MFFLECPFVFEVMRACICEIYSLLVAYILLCICVVTCIFYLGLAHVFKGSKKAVVIINLLFFHISDTISKIDRIRSLSFLKETRNYLQKLKYK